MADKVFLRFSLVLWVVFMSSGWLAASTEKVEVDDMEIDPEGELCQLLTSVFSFACGNETSPGPVCRLFGKFLANIGCMKPCMDVAQYSLCVHSPLLCVGNVVPFGYCPNKFVCCFPSQKLQYQKQQQRQQHHRSQKLR